MLLRRRNKIANKTRDVWLSTKIKATTHLNKFFPHSNGNNSRSRSSRNQPASRNAEESSSHSIGSEFQEISASITEPSHSVASLELSEELQKEIREHSFISIERIEDIIIPERIQATLSLSNVTCSNELAQSIHSRAPKLFAILLANKHEDWIEKCLDLNIDDSILPLLTRESPVLITNAVNHNVVPIDFSSITTNFQSDLYEWHWVVPAPFSTVHIEDYPPGYIPPLYSENNTIESGISKVRIGGGHLQGFLSKTIVVRKLVGESTEKKSNPKQEAEMLLARQHPCIIPLLAAFTTRRNDYSEPNLNILLSHAEGGDMENWLASSKTTPPTGPSFLTLRHSDENRCFINESILGLLSGLSFIHSNIGGQSMGHFDLKPKNILLFLEEGRWIWKIADFGHACMKYVAEGFLMSDLDRKGTHEYLPPETYSTPSGENRFDISFDLFPMGCIIIQLATIAAYGWEGGHIDKFRENRRQYKSSRRLNEDDSETDCSFQNSMEIVQKWISELEKQDQQLSSLLNTARCMIELVPQNRIFAFDATLDLWEMSPKVDIEEYTTQCQHLIQSPEDMHENYNLKSWHNPLTRLEKQPRTPFHEVRMQVLRQKGWGKSSLRICEPDLDDDTLDALPPHFRNTTDCIPRTQYLDAIESKFQQNELVVTLWGVGGCGKSYLAWRYASRLRSEERAVFWVDAQNQSSFENSCSDIARRLHKGKQNYEDPISLFSEWLKKSRHKPWLLILDTVKEESFRKLKTFLRGFSWDRILLTTTSKDIAVSLFEPAYQPSTIHVGPFSEAEGMELMKRCSPRILAMDNESMAVLAKYLKYPLFIQLVASAVCKGEENRGSNTAFLEGLFQKSKQNMYACAYDKLRDDIFETVFGEFFAKAKKGAALIFLVSCCFHNERLDMELLQLGWFKETSPLFINEQYTTFTNQDFLSVSGALYNMHSVIQACYLQRAVKKRGVGWLFKGFDIALNAMSRKYNSIKYQGSNVEPTNTHLPYLNKLEMKCHLEEILKFVKNPDFGSETTCAWSRRSAKILVSLTRIFQHEGRFEDAIAILSDILKRGVSDSRPVNEKPEYDEKRDAAEILLAVRFELLTAYHDKAHGRDSTKLLQEAECQAIITRKEGEKLGDNYLLSKIYEREIEILMDLCKKNEAQKVLESFKTLKFEDKTNQARLELRRLKIQAKLRSRSKNHAVLLRAKEDWDHLIGGDWKDLYTKPEIEEKLGEWRKSRASTSLACAEVLAIKKPTPGWMSDMDKAIRDAIEEFSEIYKATRKAYKNYARSQSLHSEVLQAHCSLAFAYFRRGVLMEKENSVTRARKAFSTILKQYESTVLEDGDQNVRDCAYHLRDVLQHLATQNNETEIENEIKDLTLKYRLQPLSKAD